jgi:alpha-methylacyl-CoA racemase
MLAMLGRPGEPPVAPQNLLGDYGGGGLYLAFGILAALYERERSGRGQVIDGAIVDGAASMLAPIMGMVAAGLMPRNPAEGMLAGRALFYRTYACADGRHLAVGALEPRFRKRLAEILGVAPAMLEDPENERAVEALFAARTRDEWVSAFAGVDCCVTPVLDLGEAAAHPQLAARGTFVAPGGVTQPSPAPRFSRTPGAIQGDGDAAQRLRDWGIEGEGPER